MYNLIIFCKTDNNRPTIPIFLNLNLHKRFWNKFLEFVIHTFHLDAVHWQTIIFLWATFLSCQDILSRIWIIWTTHIVWHTISQCLKFTVNILYFGQLHKESWFWVENSVYKLSKKQRKSMLINHQSDYTFEHFIKDIQSNVFCFGKPNGLQPPTSGPYHKKVS